MSHGRRAGFLVGLLVASVFAGALAGAASASHAEPEFAGDGVVRIDQGDTADVTVVEPTDADSHVTVIVGSEDAGFVAEATVNDADGDDRVTLSLNSSTAGNGNAASYLAVSDGDELVGATQDSRVLTDGLDGGNYELAVSAAGGNATDVGTLAIRSPEVSFDQSVFHAEADGTTTVSGRTDLASGTTVNVTLKSADTSSPYFGRSRTTVADDGTFAASFDTSDLATDAALSVALESDGRRIATLDTPWNGSSADTVEPAFERNVVTAPAGSEVDVTVTDASEQNRYTTVFVGDAADDGFSTEIRVSDGNGDDRVTISLNTDEAGNGNAESFVSVSDGDELVGATQHSHTLSTALADGDYAMNVSTSGGASTATATLALTQAPVQFDQQPVTAGEDDAGPVGVENTSIDHEGDAVTLTATSGAVISGQTDLPAGSTVTLSVASEDPTTPFLVREAAQVTENGSFAGTVDLSDIPDETAVEVSVRGDGRTLHTVDGNVVDCVRNCSSPAEWPSFEQSVVTGQRGDTVGVPISVPASDRVNVTIGDAETDGFELRATVHDVDEDGRVVVELDTAAAGNGSPSEYLSLTPGDAAYHVQQPSHTLDDGLDGGNYDLAVGPADEPYDVGTLALRASSQPNEKPSDDGPTTPSTVETTGEATFITAGDTLRLGNARGQSIVAEAELEPGATVTLALASTDASSPFLLQRDVTVTEYGTFNATVDLRDLPANTTLEVVARHDGEAVGATAARVVSCDGDCQRVAGTVENTSANATSRRIAGTHPAAPNVVVVDEKRDSIPAEGLGAVGVGGVLSLLGVGRFTGILRR